MSDEEAEIDFALFTEPENFRPLPPSSSQHVFERLNGEKIEFSLVGQHSLWAHVAWNAGIWMANYIEKCPELVKGKRVLELGAGAALPSIVSASEGATMVTATDYPDIELIQNMANNIARNVKTSNINVTGFMWGSDAQCLLNASGNCAYDVIIMCDLVFNHSQHHNMLKTCAECLSDDGIILCTFTHHRPWLADRDLQLFEIASEYGFMVSDEGSYMMQEMFQNDPGDLKTRQTVFFKTMRRLPQTVE